MCDWGEGEGGRGEVEFVVNVASADCSWLNPGV